MGHPTLKNISEKVTNDELKEPWFKQLLQDLYDTMKATNGIGIAAPQIDVSKQVALIEIPANNPRYGMLESSPLYIMINPEITFLTDEKQEFFEGCLSVPGLRGLVRRCSKIRVDYLNEKGVSQSLEFENFLATVFQHEIDHLFGKLYVEKMENLSTLTFTEEYEQFHKT